MPSAMVAVAGGGGGGGDTKSNFTGSFISGAILGGAISCVVYPVKRHFT